MKEFIRSITDSLSQTSDSMETAAGQFIPITDDYWLGDKVGSWTDNLIPDTVMNPTEVSSWFEDQMKDNLQLYKMERETRMIRPSGMPQQITILPTVSGDERKRNIFDLLEQDAVDVLTEAEPVFGRREILRSPYEMSDAGSLTPQDEVHQANAVIAPFSRYTPTVLWPFSTDSGERYTVHDLGEENLDFPGKPIAEYALGRELDRVGALPGFHMWGDPLLGVAPVAIGGGTALIIGATAWMWGPAIVNRTVVLAKATTFGLLELGTAVLSKAKDIAKAAL